VPGLEAVAAIVGAVLLALGRWWGRKTAKEANQNDLTELQQKAIAVLLEPLTERVAALEEELAKVKGALESERRDHAHTDALLVTATGHIRDVHGAWHAGDPDPPPVPAVLLSRVFPEGR